MANNYGVPSFGASVNPAYSPKSYTTSPNAYQPMPIVASPSFGTPYGRSQTPTSQQHNRHTSYNKDPDMTPPIQPSVERVRRHHYYIDGGDIIFLVENYLFRVHRYFFERESPVFRKQLAEAAHAGHPRIGMSDTDPCVLHDVRTDDFSRFLWVFYNPVYSIYEASTEDWAAILGLAHHWQFSEVKSLVVRELEKQIIPSITKIVIYHRYGVDRNLLLPSYMDLCQRPHSLDFEEAKDLGLETSMMIMTAREIVRKGDGGSSAAVLVTGEELKHVIRQIFRFPGPRSDTPISTASDATVAEQSTYPDPNEHLPEEEKEKEKPADLPPINTDTKSIPKSEPTAPAPAPAAASTGNPITAESLASLMTGNNASAASTQHKKENSKEKIELPIPLAAPAKDQNPAPASKNGAEPPTPVQGAQFGDDNRPATPTAGRFVTAPTLKTPRGAKNPTVVAPEATMVPPTPETKPEPTVPKAATTRQPEAGSAKLGVKEVKVDVAGDVVKVVDVDTKKVQPPVEVKDVDKVDNKTGPGDDMKIDTKQHEQASASVEHTSKPAAGVVNLMDSIGSLLGNELGAGEKKKDAKVPWPMVDGGKGLVSPKDKDAPATVPVVAKAKKEALGKKNTGGDPVPQPATVVAPTDPKVVADEKPIVPDTKPTPDPAPPTKAISPAPAREANPKLPHILIPTTLTPETKSTPSATKKSTVEAPPVVDSTISTTPTQATANLIPVPLKSEAVVPPSKQESVDASKDSVPKKDPVPVSADPATAKAKPEPMAIPVPTATVPEPVTGAKVAVEAKPETKATPTTTVISQTTTTAEAKPETKAGPTPTTPVPVSVNKKSATVEAKPEVKAAPVPTTTVSDLVSQKSATAETKPEVKVAPVPTTPVPDSVGQKSATVEAKPDVKAASVPGQTSATAEMKPEVKADPAPTATAPISVGQKSATVEAKPEVKVVPVPNGTMPESNQPLAGGKAKLGDAKKRKTESTPKIEPSKESKQPNPTPDQKQTIVDGKEKTTGGPKANAGPISKSEPSEELKNPTPTPDPTPDLAKGTTPTQENPLSIPDAAKVPEPAAIPDLLTKGSEHQSEGQALLALKQSIAKPKKPFSLKGESLEDMKKRLLGKKAATKAEDKEKLPSSPSSTPTEYKSAASSVVNSPALKAQHKGVNALKFSMSNDVPLSDDDEFLDCVSTAGSVSNFGDAS